MPFDNSIVVLKLTGAELFEFVRRAVEGTAHSGIEASGITIEVTQAAGGKRTLTGLRVGADALDQARVYRVAMNSFMADGGDAYIDKVPPGEKRTDDVLLLRDMLEQMFVNKKQVTAATDNRYKVTKS
jgi:5'-nucleotidase